MTKIPSNNKIILLSNKLGYSTLLYWDFILSGVKRKFHNFKVFTAEKPKKCHNFDFATEHVIRSLPSFHDKKWLGNLSVIPTPTFIFRLIREKPQLILINEFNFISFFVIISRFFFRKAKILLLVESDPFRGRNYPKKLSHTLRRQLIASSADHILTNNEIGKKYLVEYLRQPADKIMVAPYMTSTPPQKKDKGCQTPSQPHETVNFLFVGQLIDRKGIDLLLNALAEIPAPLKNRIHMDIIGDGEKRNTLIEQTRKLKLDECVTFHGAVDFSRLEVFYQKADCFILPTRHDYRALVGFEALTYGLPIIASVNDGARFEIVEEGKNGFIIDPDDTRKFTDTITRIIEKPEILEDFSKHSQKLAQKFTPAEAVKNFCNAIEKCLAK